MTPATTLPSLRADLGPITLADRITASLAALIGAGVVIGLVSGVLA